jgi:N-acetyl-alpha-D-muramate 1-phosphate uridylyltransferase
LPAAWGADGVWQGERWDEVESLAMPGTRIAAMLLAAGRGERMRPLTDNRPKPLLSVRGKPLMQWSLEALRRGGVTRVVVNTAWLGEQIEQSFGTSFVLELQTGEGSPLSLRGEQKSLQIAYSHEGRDFGGALETAGGISRALPLLCQPDARGESAGIFWLLAGDVFAPDFVFSQDAVERFAASGKLAHLWLVPNPAHNAGGDFGLSSEGLALNQAQVQYTYSTIGLYRSKLFASPWCDIPAGNPRGVKAPLAPLLRAAVGQGLISAEIYHGDWTDVGTPERLQQLNGDKP